MQQEGAAVERCNVYKIPDDVRRASDSSQCSKGNKHSYNSSMKLLVASVVLLVAFVAAEPPVNSYLPPGYETTNQDRFSPPPSTQFDAITVDAASRSIGHSSAPSSQYGAPSRQYSAPSSQYGAPSRHSAPSSQYGAPSRHSAPSSQYGAPSRQHSAPSSQYGAPSRQYSAPSSQYGAPAARTSFSSSRSSHSGSRFSGATPSAQYGAPAQTSAVFRNPQPQYSAPAPAPVYGPPSGGYNYARNSAAQDDLAEPANYEYSYNVQDEPVFSHRESRQGETAWGSYEVLLPDGRKQIVEYEADEQGYRPKIRYEENQGGYNYAAGRNAGGPY